MLGCADEACDAFDDLAFGLQVLLLWFFAQEHHYRSKTDRTHVRLSPAGHGWEPSSQGWLHCLVPAGPDLSLALLPFFTVDCSPTARAPHGVLGYLSCFSPW